MMQPLQRLIRGRMATAVPYYLALNLWRRLRNRWRLAHDHGGSTHASMSVDQSLAHIEAVYQTYCFFGDLGPEQICNKRILEVGPGDNLGVALRFLLDGAKEVVALDRFYSYRNNEQQTRIYRALQARYGPAYADLCASMIRVATTPPDRPAAFTGFRYIHGLGLEEARSIFPPAAFDLIVSTAVMEHLSNVDVSLAVMDYLLAPGGMMLHQIDFRDHGMFTTGGQHPLAFLTLAPRLWYHMTSEAGGAPNRTLMNHYREKMAVMRYTTDYHISLIISGSPIGNVWRRQLQLGVDYTEQDVGLLRQIRPRLRPEYRQLSDEDLLTAGLFLKARKPLTGS